MADVRLTWLGHSAFRLETARGKILLLDPWLRGNPACPEGEKDPKAADALLITHGHFDHIGDAVDVARKLKPTVVAIYETTVWLERKGVENCLGMNKGGTVEVAGGVKVTMVYADHSCGITDDDGRIVYGGDPCGYVVELENGTRIYHAGDTNVFGDMKLIGELYQPHVALLPIGGLYTMAPREAALAVKLLGVKRVVPMHHGTFPALTGTPDALRALTRDVPGLEIVALEPGETCTA